MYKLFISIKTNNNDQVNNIYKATWNLFVKILKLPQLIDFYDQKILFSKIKKDR